MSLGYSGAEPQPSLAWTFESSNVDSVTSLQPSAQVSPGPAQLQGSAALITNAPTSNTAVYFPGTTSTWMNLGTSTPINFDTSLSNIFVECWVYSSRAYNPNFITWHQGASGGQENWSMYFDTAGTLYTSIWGDVAGTATQGGVAVSSAIGLNTWTHIGFAIASTASVYKTYIYVNGTPTSTTPPTGWVPRFYASGITQIGGRNSSSDLTNMYIRDLRVVQGGIVPTTTFTPGAAPFTYASPTYVANMGTTVFTLLGQFVTYNPSGKYGSSLVVLAKDVGGDSTPAVKYLTYPISFATNLMNGFSVCHWIKFFQLPAAGTRSLIWGGADSYFNQFAGGISSGMYDGSGFPGTYYNFTPVIGTWYHYASVYGNGTIRTYLNGSQVGTGGFTTARNLTSSTLNIASDGGVRQTSAEYDDFRIYQSALTAAQVQSVYSSQGAPAPGPVMPLPKLAWDFNGTTAPYIGSATGTTTGTVSYNSNGKYGQSLVITNTAGVNASNYVSYNTGTIFTSRGTQALWLKTYTLGTGSQYILNFDSNAGGGISYALSLSSTNQVSIRVGAVGDIITSISTTATLTVGKWHHIAVVIDGSSHVIYIDGVISAGPNPSNTIGLLYANPRIGGSSNLPRVLVNGELDDLCIFDRALTSAQVQAIYNQQGVPGRGVTTKVVPTFTVSDQSQNPLTLSTYGTIVTNSSSPIGGTEGCLSNCAIAIPSSVSKTNFNFFASNCFVEWFFYSAGSASGYPRIFSRGLYPNEPFFIEHIAPGDRLLLSGFSTYSGYSPSFPLNQWNHFSYSFNSQNSTLYRSINGSVMSEVQTVLPTHSTLDSVYINCGLPGQTDMKISNFRLVQNATTLPYITNGFTVPTAPLSIYPTGTTALLLRSVSPLTMFSGGAIQSATGGDTVQDIGGYRIHTFTTVGTSTFTPASAGNVEVLVVAGGGGSGGGQGGAGGGGGLIYNSSFPVSGAVTVTVGGGGAGGSTIGTAGSNGGNSIFSSLSAIGGGGGGGDAGSLNGQNGGSGGGSGAESTIGTGGAGTSGQGNNGGTASITGGGYGGGGGGGAGATGGNGTGSTGGQGGNGLPYSISGSSVYYAGGGGGGIYNGNGTPGTGGLGGGGNGAGSGNGQNGTNGTGGGGGAGGTKADGILSNGGSGIVIVRYPLPVRLTGTPLFTQLSSSAVASSVGAFSLRAVNGTSARAVQVRPVAAFPPAAMTGASTSLSGYIFGGSGTYVASASSTIGGFSPWRAFDKLNINDANEWAGVAGNYPSSTTYAGSNATTVSSTSYPGEWLQIQFPSFFLPTSITITSPWNAGSARTFAFAGSVDGTNWDLLINQTSATILNTNNTSQSFPITTNSTYKYFRLILSTAYTTYGQVGELVIFGSTDGSATDFYADRIGNLLTAPVVGQSLATWLGGATGYVTTWYNQIQPGQDVSATVAANQPTIDPVNKTIVFNGTNQSFSNTATTGGLLAASAGTGTKYTYVARFTPTATFRSVVEHNSVGFTGSNRSALLIYGTSYGFNGEGNDTFNTLAPVTLGTAYSAVMRVDNTLAGYTANGNKNIRLRSNGTDYSAATGNYAILNLNNYWFTIGRKGSNNSEFFNGSMKNVMVFKDALSDADTVVLDAWQQSI